MILLTILIALIQSNHWLPFLNQEYKFEVDFFLNSMDNQEYSKARISNWGRRPSGLILNFMDDQKIIPFSGSKMGSGWGRTIKDRDLKWEIELHVNSIVDDQRWFNSNDCIWNCYLFNEWYIQNFFWIQEMIKIERIVCVYIYKEREIHDSFFSLLYCVDQEDPIRWVIVLHQLLVSKNV